MSDKEALHIFLNSPVTQDMIHNLVNVTLQILPCESSKVITQQLPTPPNSPPVYKTRPLPSLMTFITKLVRYTNVYTGTLMSTIVYMNRLKERLPADAHGMPCTRHRIFLACLIIASKYFNDSSPKNKHWSKYTDGLFRNEDVNLMEKQLLMLLDWDLRIETSELLRVWRRFLEPIKTDLRRQSRMMNNIAPGTMAYSTQTITAPRCTLQAYESAQPINYRYHHTANGCNNNKKQPLLNTLYPYASYQNIHSRSSSLNSSRSSISDYYEENHSRTSSVSSTTTVSSSGSNYSSCDKQAYIPVPYSAKLDKQQKVSWGYSNAGCSSQQAFANTQMSSYFNNCALNEQQQLENAMRQYCGGY